jgi:hypothetical protein
MASASGVGSVTYVTSASSRSELSSFVQVSEIGPFVWSSNLLTVGTGMTLNPTGSADNTNGQGTALSSYLKDLNSSGSASASIFLPQSSTPLVSGSTIILEAHVEKWRFGVWIQEIVTATYPA